MCTARLEIVQNFKKLKDLEQEFNEISKGTKYDGLNKVTSIDVKAQKETDSYGKQVYKCTLCDFTRVRKGAIENHMYQDHSSSGLECPLCNYTMGKSRAKYKHLKKKPMTSRVVQIILCNLLSK